MTDQTITGTLTVNQGITGRSTLFMASFSRLSSLAVVGLVHATGNVEADGQVVASSGFSTPGDCNIGTNLVVQGATQLNGTTVHGSLTATGTCTATALEVEASANVSLNLTVGAHVISQPKLTVLSFNIVDLGGTPIPGVQVSATGTDAGGQVFISVASGTHSMGPLSTVTLLYGVSYGGSTNSVAIAAPSAGTWGTLTLAATGSQAGIIVRCVPGTGPATLTAGNGLLFNYIATGIQT